MKLIRFMPFIVALFWITSCTTEKAEAPNVIIILADDLGYGDIQAYNPGSEIPTPHLNKLSEEGIMFRDAHTPSSICTPTRYGLLTGRYCWRTPMKRGVLKGYDPPLIQEDRFTIADYFSGKGYHTGIVGKWHLGLGFQTKQDSDDAASGYDLTQPLTVSPNDNGFDYSFIYPSSLDFDPYIYIKNKEVVDTEFEPISAKPYPYSWSDGLKSKSLEFDEVLDDLLHEAKAYITRQSEKEEPFFLYFPLTAPHVPVLPEDRFMGTSGKGWYGDFIIQVDWTAGEIFNLLEELDIADNTLLIFTSDNGSPMRTIYDSAEPDAVTDETLRYYNAENHKSNAMLRGIKGDTYEGGHRVPFVVRWPEMLSGGKKVDATICLTDLFKTLAEATGGSLPEGSAEDSYSFYSVLSGDGEEVLNRPPIIHHSGGKGMYAIRDGAWKLILGNGSGARTRPVGTPFGEPYQLFNLEKDLSETKNLIESETEVAEKLENEFWEIKGSNPYDLAEEKVQWMKESTRKQLDGCRVKGADSTWIHTPDGVGNYKALWTRDFYYMVEYAGDLMDPDEIKASIHYLLNGQRDDGCIPDRVNVAGEPVYSPGPPGKPMSDHALDNGPFMAMLVCSYVNQNQDEALFREVEPKLKKALDFVRTGDDGLVYNHPDDPQCVYGFTDIVLKTGNLLFSSLLYYKANLEMYRLCEKYEAGTSANYKSNFQMVKQNINKLWNEEVGMFWAAGKDCRQLDIWGSAYAVDIGITNTVQAGRISDYLVDHVGEFVLNGQIRHLPLSEGTWDRLFKPCEPGTYQNGAYWATPLAWIIPAMANSSPAVAKEVLETTIKDFQDNGINECINTGYKKVPNFVVSATNVYALTR